MGLMAQVSGKLGSTPATGNNYAVDVSMDQNK